MSTPNTQEGAKHAPKYALIQLSDTASEPETIHFFDTQDERSDFTTKLIHGEDCYCPELAILSEHGCVSFEGDPGLEWRPMYAPDLLGMSSHEALLSALEEVLEDAVPEKCPSCDGSGKRHESEDACHRCGGCGEVVDYQLWPDHVRRARKTIKEVTK